MFSDKTRVGIIIPIYDRPDRFRFLLQGLENQYNFDNFYTIVINDNPEDTEIENVCDEFENKLKIIYIRNEKNIGPGLSRNKGLDWCQENDIEYVMFMDADDFLLPGGIKHFLHYAITFDADLVFNDFLMAYYDFTYKTTTHFDNLIFVFSKIYKMSAIGNLRFTDLKVLEDCCFNMMFFDTPRNYHYQDLAIHPYIHISYPGISMTEKMQKTNNYLNSQPYNSLLAINKFLEYSQQDNIYDEFTNNYISKIYTIYEDGISSYPNNKKEFDDIATKILKDQRVRNLFNNPYLYIDETNRLSFEQYCFSEKNTAGPTMVNAIDNIHFFKDSMFQFFENHGYIPDIDFTPLKNKENMIFAYKF